MVCILVLEDDQLFNETLEDFLEEEGYAVETAMDPYSALEMSYKQVFDLYLFDVNLPYENGFDLLQKLRQSGDTTPTIFLTSREDKASLSEGFEKGADDYMKKPIDLDELMLRIQAVLRRQIRQERIIIGEYSLDTAAKTLYLDGETLDVTKKAIELLLLLIQAKGEVVSSDEIKGRLWAAGQSASDGALRVYITQLKKYFPENIVNIRGVGYRWAE
ncbi:response regulator transcription factor [Sulfurovum sp. NBC37-1]|uniref:response regulator transcription factor n=1 Tax=Sulfurovum sp. (strain NBC37-1) TaxID=387093 RepID=UPI0001587C68|nr:response regulator transcription factor [Sulfurovum sp. NBC37-1]BAF73127.1 two-component response regulator [Sulfurovum sp. NBC37-1]